MTTPSTCPSVYATSDGGLIHCELRAGHDSPHLNGTLVWGPGTSRKGRHGSGGRTAALCIGCGWCCQSTPRERRGEAHQGCH